jgi:hypothetical protein
MLGAPYSVTFIFPDRSLFVFLRPHEGEEGVMFQMIDESKPTAEDRKLFWYKVGLFLIVAAAFGGIIYFVAVGTTG